MRIGAPGGTPRRTDLTLRVGGDLVLSGGSRLTTARHRLERRRTPQPNTIQIEAGGSVIAEFGQRVETGVRIGSASQNGTAGGDISINAGGIIELAGTGSATAIRTLGNVTLDGVSLSESHNGFIIADTLTTKSRALGRTSLEGPNQVANFNGTSAGDLASRIAARSPSPG